VESKKGALKEHTTVLFGDESAFYLLPSVVRTWARVGQTPVLRPVTRREHLSVASAIGMQGELITQTQEKSFNGAGIVSFLSHLLEEIPGKIVLIWDGAKIHHCAEVKEFLKRIEARRLRLIRLPAYSPELNPDEGVWRWLKRELGNACADALATLTKNLREAIKHLRRKPHVIQGFFRMAGLPI
jgi:transposase